MPYMLAPGARLVVGPGGRLEESLGACCPSCARGRRCESLGAGLLDAVKGLVKPAVTAADWAAAQTGKAAAQVRVDLAQRQQAQVDAVLARQAAQQSATPGFQPLSSTRKVILVAGLAAAVGAYMVWGRGKRRGRRA